VVLVVAAHYSSAEEAVYTLEVAGMQGLAAVGEDLRPHRLRFGIAALEVGQTTSFVTPEAVVKSDHSLVAAEEEVYPFPLLAELQCSVKEDSRSHHPWEKEVAEEVMEAILHRRQ
jgi:hypothetical protein